MSLIQRCISITIIAALSNSVPLLAQQVQFHRRPTRPFDNSRQVIECDFVLERAIRQQNQLIDSTRRILQRRQDRTLTILSVQAGRPRRAKITYLQSFTQIEQAESEPIQAVQPVTGKTYFVELHGDDLIIMDPQGQKPPPDELAIVSLNLQSFGKPNPLAKYLDGKIVSVGQSLAVPNEVASELLGFTGSQGDTEKLSLKMVATKNVDGNTCAVFETILRATNRELGAMNLLMEGELTIEADSCRTRAIMLRGPVAITQIRGSAAGQFTVSTNGTLQVAVEANYTSARQR